MTRELVERLKQDAAQLRKMSELAAFGGEETGVRVKSVDLLLADLDEAAARLTALTAERDELETQLALACGELHEAVHRLFASEKEIKRLRAAPTERNAAESALTALIAAENQRLFDRAEAAEQEIARLREALEGAERKMVDLYRSMSPHANLDTGGNRFADEDEDVIASRAALGRAEGDGT